MAGSILHTGPQQRAFEDSIEDPMLLQGYRYWREKRGARPMPRRCDIDPAEIPRLLPHLMITEMLEGGTRYRYRLSGTAVTEAFGRSLTGKYIDELMTGAYREFLERLYRTIYLERRCVYGESRYAVSDKPSLATKRLLMPLSEDGVEVNQVLAVQTFQYASHERSLVVFDNMGAFVDAGVELADGGAK
jgi:hypothetical protein